MARRKLKNKNVRKITRVGGTSLAVTIPVEMTRKLKWRERQKACPAYGRRGEVVKLRGEKLVVEDWGK